MMLFLPTLTHRIVLHRTFLFASLFAMTCMATPSFAQTSSATAKAMNADNPFFQPSALPFHAPDFAAIRNEHYLPAFEAGMKEQIAEMQAIAEQPAAPTFENTLVAMERTGLLLQRVQKVFMNMSSAHTDEAIQEIELQLAPRLAAHSDDILLNPKLFARVEALWKQRTTLQLNEEQSELLRQQYEEFVRAGARLDLVKQKRIREMNEELSGLTTQFQNNLLAITKEAAVIVDDASQLTGMNEADVAAAKEAAQERKLDGKFLLAITNTTRQPILTSLQNRELRRRVWEASAYRGLGRDGSTDNRPLVLKIASLRAERASLLGYANDAAYTLEDQMAKTPEAAFKMLKDLVPQVRQKAEEEAAEILTAMKQDGLQGPVQPWDWEYYAEKVRQSKYQFDETQIKPFFELDSVLKNGVFFTMNQLYGITFRERTDLPVYQPTVRVFDVLDSHGKQLGLFYADYYQRDSKAGGAWMDSFIDQSRLLQDLPVVVNVMNVPRPAEGQPTLLSFDNVVTMFHELGHGVHGLLSNVEYPSVSGTSVPRDFVEFPSTFHEDWAIDPVVLKNYARHYQTGETIPGPLLNKAIEASKFNKGYETLEYLAAAILDLAWHSQTTGQVTKDVEGFEEQVRKQYGVDFAPVPPRYRSQYFAHIWSGGYSSGYYAYLWSEVLAADAFAHMKEQGGLKAANGKKYQDCILSRGGSRAVMQQYLDFRGSEPQVGPLLRRRGLQHPTGNKTN